MNREKIERLAVEAVKASLYETDRLMPNIDENDRTPSWDGDVRVYRVRDSSKKADLKGLVRVQVKGHLFTLSSSKNNNEFPKKIRFDVEVADLKNYFNDQGAIFFVVYIDPNSEKRKIYFSEFLPLTLANLLKDNKNKNIRLDFNEFPENSEDKVDVFLNFINNRLIQGSIPSNGVIDEKVLCENKLIQNYVVQCLTCKETNRPTDLLFSVSKKFVCAETSLGLIPLHEAVDFKIKNENLPITIGVNGKTYYEKVAFEKSKELLVYFLGNNIKLELTEGGLSLKYYLQGTLEELINDLGFLKDISEAGKFEFEGHELLMADGNSYNEYLAFLPMLKDLQKVFAVLDIKSDIKIDVFNLREHASFLRKLVSGLVDHELIEIEQVTASNVVVEVMLGNFSILVLARKDVSGKYYLDDLFKTDMNVTGTFEDRDYVLSKYVLLSEKQLFNCININFAEIRKEILQMELNEAFLEFINQLLLKMLSAYDKQAVKNPELLETALVLADHLYKNEQNSINLLNYCQILVRKQGLSAAEKEKLSELKGTSSAMVMEKLGAAILLENFGEAEKYYQQLSETERKHFDGFPINYLWKR